MRWIGTIRSKADVETRIEHVEFEYLVLTSKPWGEVRWARRHRSGPRSAAWPHVQAQHANGRRVDHLRRPPDVPPRGVVLRLRLIACVRRHTRRPFWIAVFPCPADGPLSWLAAGRPRAWDPWPGGVLSFGGRQRGQQTCATAVSMPVLLPVARRWRARRRRRRWAQERKLAVSLTCR